jgi:hypothetical protein
MPTACNDTLQHSFLPSGIPYGNMRFVYGQISTQEEPISFFRADVPALRTNERTEKRTPLPILSCTTNKRRELDNKKYPV